MLNHTSTTEPLGYQWYNMSKNRIRPIIPNTNLRSSISAPNTFPKIGHIIFIENGVPNKEFTPYIPPPPPALKLIWQDITAISFNVTDVNSWNGFFNLPTQGTPFTSVEIIGNEVKLFGGSNIDVQSYQFKDGNFTDAKLVSIIDEINCIISIGDYSFAYQQVLETVLLPAVIYAYGQEIFSENLPLKNINLRSCIQLGESVGNNLVFFSITNQTITLTIPSVLMTCNAGNPDGDIQYLQANNNVIITTV